MVEHDDTRKPTRTSDTVVWSQTSISFSCFCEILMGEFTSSLTTGGKNIFGADKPKAA